MTKPVSVEKLARNYVPHDFKLNAWEDIESLCEDLVSREINSVDDLIQWLKDRSEFEAIVGENQYRRYINKTIDTENKEFEASYNFFVEHIAPQLMESSNEMDKKLYNSPFTDELDKDRYYIYLRSVKNNLDLYRKENIPLFTKLDTDSKQYYGITGRMMIEKDGEELTLQQASKFLEDKDREVRASVLNKMTARRLEDKDVLDKLYDDLLVLRQQVAVNAGFDNYRDFKLQQLGRFDYGVKECEQFHDAVELEIVPLVDELLNYRKEQLDLDTLKPYDLEVDLGDVPLPSPFKDIDELVSKSIDCLEKVDPFFAGCLLTMKQMGHLDLDSRKGKGPGGYNCGLPETKVPFIFMNAASTAGDVRTMIHEGGHAVHSFLMNELEYNFDTHINSEEAELASMSMELFALDSYDSFYTDGTSRKRAIYNSLENMLVLIPWIALIDKFQHWVYTHPGHSRQERSDKWLEMHKRFSSKVIDYTGFEESRANLWQRQLHLFLIPFYYIEYGIAQLGAIGMWRNFIKDPAGTIENYKQALSLGNTRTLPEMYETAGVPFDFSREYISELKEFVRSRLN